LQINKGRGTHKKIVLALALMSTMLLASCDNDRHIHDLKKYVDDQRKTSAKNQKLSAATQLHFPTAAAYQSGARSPFEEATYSSAASKLHPLQSYPLNNLKFKGTVAQKDSILAFILAPDNKLYQVTTGDIIGDHYGKITHIYPDHLEIEEQVQQVSDNGSQTATTRLVTLQLKE
jgi:Tfp pilus assembly protein PilP